MKDEVRSFPKSARLLDQRDFERVFRAPNKSSDRYFTVLSRLNGGSVARLGLAISRKCAPNSVDRNRLKRLIRERFRLMQIQLYGIDVVVLCRYGTASTKNSELISSLRTHFNNIKSKP